MRRNNRVSVRRSQLSDLVIERHEVYAAGYDFMNGYGSHTFMWYNEANEKFWVKFHFHTEQGIKNLSDAEAGQIRADEVKLDSYTLSSSIG